MSKCFTKASPRPRLQAVLFLQFRTDSGCYSLTREPLSATIAAIFQTGLPVLFNRLSCIVFAAGIMLAHCAYADENENADSHLPFVQGEEALAPATAPQLTPSTRISAAATKAEDRDAGPSAKFNHDLWHRIRDGFGMRELDSKLIARHEKWYASRPEYMGRMFERAQRYLFYITEEVERRDMPSEIALLPMIESAFNPGAYSVGRASGIWQFIPSTGKNFGMEQNWWYDERRDIISATNGALDYLQKLHEQFGDWELALAAYNWGEGAVSRAQLRNRRAHKPTNFASLRLPPETQNYVPKLLAIKNIVSNPERFGLKLSDIPNRPYFAAVATSHRMDVKLAAELADISLEEFNALNPGHNRPVMLEETATVLLLPIDKIEKFQANLENNEQPLVSWQPYQSKKGERFDQMAPRFGLSGDKLRSINGLSARAQISTGQTLLVPVNNADNETDEFAAFNTHLTSIDEIAGRTLKYTVRRGETLASIARRYHVSVALLQKWNSGVRKIKPGQRLSIVQSSRPAPRTRLAQAKTKTQKNRNTRMVRGSRPPKQNFSRRSIKIASNR